MADQAEIDRALQDVAESVAGRKLLPGELDVLKKSFRSRGGGTYRRALGAIGDALGITESKGQEKFAASDNADRLMQDLAQLVSPPTRPRP